jgi:hypothetical protein
MRLLIIIQSHRMCSIYHLPNRAITARPFFDTSLIIMVTLPNDAPFLWLISHSVLGPNAVVYSLASSLALFSNRFGLSFG